MKRTLSYLIFLACLITITPIYAGTQTFSTVYPSPQGNYKEMTVNDVLTFPVAPSGSCATAGGIGVANVSGNLEICDASGTYILNNNSLWKSGAGFIYPYTSTNNVEIGDNNAPTTTLGVAGTLKVSGNTTVGGTLGVTGSSNLGSAAANVAAITGSATVSNGLTVTNGITVVTGGIGVTAGGLTVSAGNTQLGPASGANTTTIYGNTVMTPAAAGKVTINGSIAGTGSVTGVNVPAIYLCNDSNVCGYLAVAQATDNNWYAVYGP
jgi:hypothetical protein